MTCIKIETDGFYHPSTEEEIICLVKKAREEGLQIRCRGSAHSVSHAIYTDPGKGDKAVPDTVSEQDPPQGPNINIMFDKYFGLEWLDEEKGLVEVKAGTHLGKDPYDPTGTSTLENSLLYQAWQKGWTLGDLGGITHQTVSGFISTGSAGGSLSYNLDENMAAFRVIDGTGAVAWVEKDKDAELFNALGVSVGLLGIISKVRFKLTSNFNVYGQETTTPTSGDKALIDVYGAGGGGKVNMQEFLEQTPYTRILWWPQKGVDRMAYWIGGRADAMAGAGNPQAAGKHKLPAWIPQPYREFSDVPFITKLMQLGGAIYFTNIGNKGFFRRWGKLNKYIFKSFKSRIYALWKKKFGTVLGWILTNLLMLLVKIFSFLFTAFFSIFPFLLDVLLPVVIKLFQPLTKKGKPEMFQDYGWRSLPMDNAADDIMLGTEFTEIWIPLEYTQKVMILLDKHFKANGLKGTGTYSTELYAGYKSDFWLSPGYGGHQFRVDVFWYLWNQGNPATPDGFYRQFWELLRKEGIPFRLHFGKYWPEFDYKEWAEFFRSQYPRWDDFMALRAKRDPGDIFLTDYWRRHLLGEV